MIPAIGGAVDMTSVTSGRLVRFAVAGDLSAPDPLWGLRTGRSEPVRA